MSPSLRILRPTVFVALLIALWQIGVSRTTTHIIPGPWNVLLGMIELGREGLLLRYVIASLFRVTWGFLMALVTAVPFGLFAGWHRRTRMAFNPLIQIFRPISPLAWIPIAILWFGVGDVSAIFLIFLASFLPLTVSAMNAVQSIDPIQLNAARNFGLSRSQVIYRVLCPAVMPQLIVGLRITLGVSWLVVVAAEMIAVNSGLGFLIIDARNAGNRYDLVVAAMVLIGVIGLLLDIGMRELETLPSVRWGFRDN